VLGPQEVKLVVALLLIHETRQELAAIARHKLCRQFDDIPVGTTRECGSHRDKSDRGIYD